MLHLAGAAVSQTDIHISLQSADFTIIYFRIWMHVGTKHTSKHLDKVYHIYNPRSAL